MSTNLKEQTLFNPLFIENHLQNSLISALPLPLFPKGEPFFEIKTKNKIKTQDFALPWTRPQSLNKTLQPKVFPTQSDLNSRFASTLIFSHISHSITTSPTTMPRPKKQQPVTYTFEEIEEARQAVSNQRAGTCFPPLRSRVSCEIELTCNLSSFSFFSASTR